MILWQIEKKFDILLTGKNKYDILTGKKKYDIVTTEKNYGIVTGKKHLFVRASVLLFCLLAKRRKTQFCPKHYLKSSDVLG